MGSTWRREGQGEQRVLSVHNWNPRPCYWTSTTHGGSSVTDEIRASKAACGVDTDDTVGLLGPDTDTMQWDFLLSLLRETCLPTCQGQSQVPRRKPYRPLSWEESGVQSSSLPFFHLLTCLMCQPGTRFTELTRQSRCSKGPSSLLGDPDL